jgi:hypothetical protein
MTVRPCSFSATLTAAPIPRVPPVTSATRAIGSSLLGFIQTSQPYNVARTTDIPGAALAIEANTVALRNHQAQRQTPDARNMRLHEQ